jgi:hypothetical protein
MYETIETAAQIGLVFPAVFFISAAADASPFLLAPHHNVG